MRFAPAALCALLTAAALTGCAGQQTTDNAADYTGDQKAIAQVIDDFSKAGKDGDAKEICNTIFATEVADKLRQGNEDCIDAVDDQLTDASDFDLEVKKITVDGATAKVDVVSQFDAEDVTRTLSLADDGKMWRITGISGDAAPAS